MFQRPSGLFMVLGLAFLLAFTSCAMVQAKKTAVVDAESWAQLAEECSNEPDRILYNIQKRPAEEAGGFADLKFSCRGEHFLHYIMVDDGPWPKDVYLSSALFGEDRVVVELSKYTATWQEDEELPSWRLVGECPPYQPCDEYAQKWLKMFVDEGPVGFEYGIFEGSIGEFWQDVIKPHVNRYNAEEVI